MRSTLRSFAMRRAVSLDEVVALLADSPGGWRPFGGGTDLMVLLAAGALDARRFVSLWGIDELRRIEISAGAVTIGAMATYSDIQRHETLEKEFPLLGCAARETGGPANQNRGTIGGNIANASPAADTPPALLVYDAELELASTRGRRRVPYDRFHRGYKQLDLAPDEIIVSVRIARGRSGWRQHYRKVGARRAQAISKVCFAGAARLDGRTVADVRVAFGSVAPTPIRATNAERTLRGAPLTPPTMEAAARALTSDLAPIDDIRSTARYRRRVAQNLLLDFLRGL
jgi:CO/xanthine dehydrogenase FAD-binding subunit